MCLEFANETRRVPNLRVVIGPAGSQRMVADPANRREIEKVEYIVCRTRAVIGDLKDKRVEEEECGAEISFP